MSTPGQSQTSQQAGPAQQAGQSQTAQQAGPAQAALPAGQGQMSRSQGAAQPSRSWSTPRLLRLARAGAASAVLLTGVAATGAFSADGLNAAPNVIAQQWVSAERAGVEIAQADLRAAERVTGGEDEAARAAFDDAVGQVGADLTAMGASSGDAAGIAQDWSTFVLGAERAAAAAGTTAEGTTAEGEGARSGADDYATASEAARSAVEATDAVAERHAHDLRTGSRSVLTGVVGTLSTLGLGALLVWLALRTRRILNLPLLAATAVTAGLTYLSINPSALPVTYDQRIGESTATATALQEVYQARQAQHAAALGLEDRWEGQAGAAQEAVDQLGDPFLTQTWDELAEGHEAATTGAAGEGAAEALSATAEPFSTLETQLRGQLESQLAASGAAVGRPAVLTSGAALLLGLVGAWLAWTGLTRRLKDYR